LEHFLRGTCSRLAYATLAGLLLASASTAALAAPKADPKLDAMQQQPDAMRAQLEEMRAAGNADAKLSAIQAQLNAMAAQLNDMKAAQDTAAADLITLKAPPATSVALPNGKPALATADGRFTANIRAIVMYDMGKSFQDDNLPPQVTNRDLNDGSNFRRARFGIDGKLFKDIDYALIYEFGGSGGEDAGHIQEAWAQWTAWKPWRIRLGAFEPNIGLAAAVSTSQMPILERPSAAEVARGVAAGDSRSALQFTGNGAWGAGDTGIATRWFLSTAVTGNTVGTINSTGGATAQPTDEQQAIIGRFTVAPFASNDWQAHVGVNAQYVFHPNDAGSVANPRYPAQLRDRPELRIDATRLVDTGGIDSRHVSVLGAEAALLVQNFTLEGEYFNYNLDRRLAAGSTLSDPKFKGWYVEGTWVLTGEARVYNPGESRIDAPKLNYNFNPSAGTWGAIELAARYSVLDLNYHEGASGLATPADGVRGGEQKIGTIGLNWYWNPDIRFMLDWQHVDIDRLGPTGLQVGQSYNAVALRSQFTF
jgi:phosphate-selective porin OprO/OprP